MFSRFVTVFCIENPPEKYWEIKAEERRVALAEALKENEEVYFVVVMVVFEMVDMEMVSASQGGEKVKGNSENIGEQKQ